MACDFSNARGDPRPHPEKGVSDVVNPPLADRLQGMQPLQQAPGLGLHVVMAPPDENGSRVLTNYLFQ